MLAPCTEHECQLSGEADGPGPELAGLFGGELPADAVHPAAASTAEHAVARASQAARRNRP
jgi:hypothetical protein